MNRMLLAVFAIAMLVGCRSGQDAGEQMGGAAQDAGEQAREAGQEARQAGDEAAQAGERAMQGQQQMATGTITEMQDDQITMRTAAGEQMEFRLQDDAQIMMNGQPMQRERLQEGANVRAAYREKGGEMMVEKLEVQSMGGAMQPGQQPGGMQPGAQPGGAP